VKLYGIRTEDILTERQSQSNVQDAEGELAIVASRKSHITLFDIN
jgi:hypothetical protein